MVHYLNLHENPFKFIKNKLKTVEMRLNDERRKNIAIGDILVFSNNITNEKISCIVKDLKVFSNFHQLYKNYDKKEIGYLENENANPNDMLLYYPQEKIDKYGSLAIHIELIEETKVIVFDMDDTLLKQDKTISEYTLNILNILKDIGHKIVINTARSKYYNQEHFDLIKPDYAILNGGTLIIDKNENIIYKNPLKINDINQFIKDILRETDVFSFQRLNDLLTNNASYKNQNAQYFDFKNENYEGDVYKIVASFRYEKAAYALAKKYNLVYVSYLDGRFGRFSNLEDSKENGNRVLSSKINIPLKDFIVFGDDVGDLNMIKEAGIGVLMKNSQIIEQNPSVNVSEYTNNEDGVARFLDKLFKISAEL